MKCGGEDSVKRLLRYPLRFLNGLLDRAFALLGALILAQFPQFYGQYLQRLGGHIDELRRTVEVYEQAASALGISLEQYIEEHLAAESEVIASSGEIISNLVERLWQLESSFQALIQATPLTRWVVFLQNADWSVVRQCLHRFTPGVPTTAEGLVYAGAGLLLGWGLYALGRLLLSAPFKQKEA
jgi:hypothetical protein